MHLKLSCSALYNILKPLLIALANTQLIDKNCVYVSFYVIGVTVPVVNFLANNLQDYLNGQSSRYT